MEDSIMQHPYTHQVNVVRSATGIARTLAGLAMILTAILLCPADSARAELPAAWHTFETWQVRASYRQSDGSWSAPVTWRFAIFSEDTDGFIVDVDGGGGSRARLFFERPSGQLRRIGLTDNIRGETVYRDVVIESNAPIYPLFSAIPYHFPLLAPEDANGTFQLQRYLNGRRLTAETISQSRSDVQPASLLETVPEAARADIAPFLSPPIVGTMYRIEKAGEMLFTQYWVPRLPWALYTESPSCRAWLARGAQ
ncbi:hypothetical protein [Desulfatitalea alkaliphila]|uniref:Uncharacterized protein n=1 Tax=Desulfatitalea alkaliphila TaxID=2929485 RepID=A0AA41R1B5_9BACT|nr:hypothetical protein [Desulfatitalea alkaliphila]MCJ8499390.1 hypothetical protein [Desulfatitalea alkaliphila]